MKHMRPHEALHCMPSEIYDDAISHMGFEVIDSVKLEKLLYRRGQFPEEYFIDDDSTPCLTDIVKKHYGDFAMRVLKINFAGQDDAKLYEL